MLQGRFNEGKKLKCANNCKAGERKPFDNCISYFYLTSTFISSMVSGTALGSLISKNLWHNINQKEKKTTENSHYICANILIYSEITQDITTLVHMIISDRSES